MEKGAKLGKNLPSKKVLNWTKNLPSKKGAKRDKKGGKMDNFISFPQFRPLKLV